MKKTIQSIGLTITLLLNGCNANNQQTKLKDTMTVSQETTTMPQASQFTLSPLRNRMKLELNAHVSEVWSLVGDPGKMPQYSAGLNSVDTKKDEKGNCIEYLCHFKPMTPGDKGVDHKAIMKWYEPMKGWASVDEEPNAFGMTESLSLLTFSESDGKTMLQWDVHFNATDLEMNKKGFEQAFADMSKQLTDRFGGRVVENSVEGQNP